MQWQWQKFPKDSADGDYLRTQAINIALAGAECYDHPKTEQWNKTIIVRFSFAVQGPEQKTAGQRVEGETMTLTCLSRKRQEKTLKAVIAEATPQGATTMPYKFAINSTIVQHVVPSSQIGRSMGTSTSTADATEGGAPKAAGSEKKQIGRRGMHSSTGGYWNEKTDGMWSYKFEGENLGLDVVLMVIWVSI